MLAFELERASRHNFMNDMQVIMGWLQLQQPDRALDHIKDMVEQFRHDADQMASLPHAWAPYLWPWISLARHRGVAVDFKMEAAATAVPGRVSLAGLRARLGAVLAGADGAGVASVTIVLRGSEFAVISRGRDEDLPARRQD